MAESDEPHVAFTSIKYVFWVTLQSEVFLRNKSAISGVLVYFLLDSRREWLMLMQIKNMHLYEAGLSLYSDWAMNNTKHFHELRRITDAPITRCSRFVKLIYHGFAWVCNDHGFHVIVNNIKGSVWHTPEHQLNIPSPRISFSNEVVWTSRASIWEYR